MATHIKFPSIPNVGRHARRVLTKYPEMASDVWYAHEKLDGCNFCIISQVGKPLRAARRNGILADHEEFHNYQAILKDQGHRMEDLHEMFPEAETIYVYGELIGNWYPHPSVKVDEEEARRRRRVHHCSTAYCPDVQFVTFDIGLVLKDDLVLRTHKESMDALKRAGFDVAPLIASGTLSELLAVPPTFSSMMPLHFGLPEFEDRPNHAEGLVLTHNAPTTGKRVRFKHKHANRREVARASTEVIHDTDAFQRHVDEGSMFITPNRLANVLSKMLPEEWCKRNQVCALLVQDALEEYGEEADLSVLSEREMQMFKKRISTHAYRIISDFYRDHDIFTVHH